MVVIFDLMSDLHPLSESGWAGVLSDPTYPPLHPISPSMVWILSKIGGPSLKLRS